MTDPSALHNERSPALKIWDDGSSAAHSWIGGHATMSSFTTQNLQSNEVSNTFDRHQGQNSLSLDPESGNEPSIAVPIEAKHLAPSIHLDDSGEKDSTRSGSIPPYLTPVLTSTVAKRRSSGENEYVNGYAILHQLGEGAYAKVHLAFDYKAKQHCAIKILNRRALGRYGGGQIPGSPQLFQKAAGNQRLKREVAILKRLRHPHIIALKEVIDDPDHGDAYLVFELATNGQLMDLDPSSGKIIPDAHGDRRLPEVEARRVTKAVISALRFAHRHGVAHRDVKPQNILLTNGKEVRLSDFGVSHIVDEWEVPSRPANILESAESTSQSPVSPHHNHTFALRRPSTPDLFRPVWFSEVPEVPAESELEDSNVLPGGATTMEFAANVTAKNVTFEGTIAFQSPELLDGSLDPNGTGTVNAQLLFYCDIWALGVTVYTMVTGCLPWPPCSSRRELLQCIQENGVKWPSHYDHETGTDDDPPSEEVRDFVGAAMRINPTERATLRDLAHHPWIEGPKKQTGNDARSTANSPTSLRSSGRTFLFDELGALNGSSPSPLTRSPAVTPSSKRVCGTQGLLRQSLSLPPSRTTCGPVSSEVSNQSFFMASDLVRVTEAEVADAVVTTSNVPVLPPNDDDADGAENRLPPSSPVFFRTLHTKTPETTRFRLDQPIVSNILKNGVETETRDALDSPLPNDSFNAKNVP